MSCSIRYGGPWNVSYDDACGGNAIPSAEVDLGCPVRKRASVGLNPNRRSRGDPHILNQSNAPLQHRYPIPGQSYVFNGGRHCVVGCVVSLVSRPGSRDPCAARLLARDPTPGRQLDHLHVSGEDLGPVCPVWGSDSLFRTTKVW